jgi:hypothetical protein
MKKVLLTLCGAVLLMALLTAPALAQGKNYQTPMLCSITAGGFVERGYAVILRPAGDLYIRLLGVNRNTLFDAQIFCSGFPLAPETSAGMSDGGGKLVVIVPADKLGLVPGLQCLDIRIEVFSHATNVQDCFEGFKL